jgi:prepilin-type processing-associated H-X9-DG protein
MLFPVFLTVREKAKSAACLSNCRQISLALQGYLGDHSDTFPAYIGDIITVPLWWHQLQPYMKSKPLLYCSATDKAYGTFNFGDNNHRWGVADPTTGYNWESSYTLNGWLYCNINDPDTRTWKIPLKLSQIPRATRTMAFSDGIWLDAWPSNMERPDPGTNLWRIFLDRHNGGINMVFVGGNAAWIAKKQLAVPDPARRRIAYNPRTGD